MNIPQDSGCFETLTVCHNQNGSDEDAVDYEVVDLCYHEEGEKQLRKLRTAALLWPRR